MLSTTEAPTVPSEGLPRATVTLSPAPSSRPPTPGRRRRVWWTTFLAFAALGWSWALASPLFSVPDEGAHQLRAVAASRGQILPTERTSKGYATIVRVPGTMTGGTAACFIFRPDVTADCAEPPLTGPDREVEAETTAGLYPPAYYLVAGLPSLPFPDATGVYLMRALNAALCAALLASAVASAWLVPDGRLVLAGIALAVTPMVLFLAGSVNPSGVEIAAAVGLWSALAVVLAGGADAHRGRLLARAAVAGSVLALSRPASPLWIAAIVSLLAVWAGWGRVRDVLRDRRTWLAGGAVALAAGSTLWWVQHYGTLDQTLGHAPGTTTLTENVRYALGNTTAQVEQMIGVFGWLDSRAATLSVWAWLVAVGALLLLGLAASGRRQAAVLLALVGAVVVLPVALQVPRATEQGFPWQGRYTLPLAVGLPILAALQSDRSRLVPDGLSRRLSAVLLALFVVGQLYGHIWATRRYTAGVDGPVNWLTAGGWQPPLPVWVLFASFVALLGAVAIWLHRLPGGPGHPFDPFEHRQVAPSR